MSLARVVLNRCQRSRARDLDFSYVDRELLENVSFVDSRRYRVPASQRLADAGKLRPITPSTKGFRVKQNETSLVVEGHRKGVGEGIVAALRKIRGVQDGSHEWRDRVRLAHVCLPRSILLLWMLASIHTKKVLSLVLSKFLSQIKSG